MICTYVSIIYIILVHPLTSTKPIGVYVSSVFGHPAIALVVFPNVLVGEVVVGACGIVPAGVYVREKRDEPHCATIRSE